MQQKKVGSYILNDEIGIGAFSTVYKASHINPRPQQIDATVAIKAIDVKRLNVKLQLAMESEVEILEKIRHKNIVRLFGCQKTKQHIYLILEYCPGGDLHRYIKRQGCLTSEVARHFLRELAQGLQFLWRHNLVHRDLKPHNLLLTSYSSSANLKIADFGFARHLGEAAMANTLCGSPLYMAPEILGNHKYDAKSDLWSVGTILFEMLAGKPPYQGSDPGELLSNIHKTALRIPKHADTTPDSIDLLSKLLKRQPIERISFQEFFNSKYVGLKPLQHTSSEDTKLFANVDNPHFNSQAHILTTVMEDSHSSNEGGGGGAKELEDEEDEDGNQNGLAFANPTSGNGSSKDLIIDDNAWEIVDDAPVTPGMTPLANNKIITQLPPLPPPLIIHKPPLPPSNSSKKVSIPQQQQLVVSAAQQKRKHASGRATTFAIEVGERAVHLAKLAERIVEAYETFEGVENNGDCANAKAAAIVIEAMRLLSLAYAAAEDAAEAAKKRNRAGNSNLLVQEIRAWLLACKEKAESLLQESSSSVSMPNPRLILYRVALGLGRRAAGRELLLVDTVDQKSELITVVEDYSLGLMLLQLLTTNNDLTLDDRRQIHGFLALFHARLSNLEA